MAKDLVDLFEDDLDEKALYVEPNSLETPADEQLCSRKNAERESDAPSYHNTSHHLFNPLHQHNSVRVASKFDEKDYDDLSNPAVMQTFYKRLFPVKQIYLWLNQEQGESGSPPSQSVGSPPWSVTHCVGAGQPTQCPSTLHSAHQELDAQRNCLHTRQRCLSCESPPCRVSLAPSDRADLHGRG